MRCYGLLIFSLGYWGWRFVMPLWGRSGCDSFFGCCGVLRAGIGAWWIIFLGRGLGARATSSGGCPAGGVVPGGYGSLLAWDGLSGLWGGLWTVSRVESSARAPCLPRFIFLVSFCDTLLVVSILYIVYYYHLRLL